MVRRLMWRYTGEIITSSLLADSVTSWRGAFLGGKAEMNPLFGPQDGQVIP